MSVGILKRLLSIINLLSILAIGGTAYGFWAHRISMSEPWSPPDFNVPVVPVKLDTGRIGNTYMRLGTFPEAVKVREGPAPEPAKEDRKAELDELGSIKSAIVVYPPYEGTKPALIFEYTNAPPGAKGKDDKIVAIELGEALVTRPHSNPQLRAWGDRENVRFKFAGCEPDPENPKWTLFLFDVNCDGKEIHKARWKGEIKTVDLPAATGPTLALRTGILRDRSLPLPRTKGATPVASPTAPPPTTATPPRPAPVIEELRGPIFENENGAFAATNDGIAYLRDNHQKILKDTYTSPYKDREGRRGVQIRKIRSKSVANQFGILEGDVIIAVNNRPVSSKAQAINVVKNELGAKKKRFIEVKVLRLGSTKLLRFDASDPATRRNAKDAFRNRR